MSLRTRFILVISVLHSVALALTFYIFNKSPILFIASEALIIVSVAFSWRLYQQLLKPLQTIADGIDAIKNKDFNVKFLHTGAPEMDRLISVYNEMMDHLKTERTRQEQQHFFLEKLIQTSPTGILILDFDGNVQQANPKACGILRVTEKEILGQPLALIERQLIHEIRELNSGEDKTVSLDGVHTYKLQRSHFIDRGFARSFVMIEELTAEILAAEKKAYGKVIRMMAHEVNNTIGPVNSILESALNTTDLWNREHETLKHAVNVAYERNQNLNVFMRNFADVVRLPPPGKTRVDLNELVKDSATLLEFKAEEARIELLLPTSVEPFVILADRHQLEQALINIIQNSMEAIGSGGSIAITFDRAAHKLTVTDSGRGIAPEHAEHLFSPFFSTKKDGQGVGLTLVKEILLNHGFEFSLRTLEIARTVFEIDFRK